MSRRVVANAAALAALSCLVTACGGDGSTAVFPTPQSPTDPPAVAIQGVATPSSVSVVTATNAN